MKKSSQDYPKQIKLYSLILAGLLLVFIFFNQPQCPDNYTQEQIDASRCIVGANIGLGMFILFIWPVFIVTLGLLIRALYKQYAGLKPKK